MLMLNEESRNAVNVTNGIFKAVTGQKILTLDNLG
jgi:hypothetical protein